MSLSQGFSIEPLSAVQAPMEGEAVFVGWGRDNFTDPSNFRFVWIPVNDTGKTTLDSVVQASTDIQGTEKLIYPPEGTVEHKGNMNEQFMHQTLACD
ncbi:hypothetical protein V5O48_014197 [Marasmius crinis-equi]|uniref:Uncharacterized protein n=1 Tax=Marasmius crinis-equi TaxID=585013 RepID=A0ABR3EXZ5_9AGAR